MPPLQWRGAANQNRRLAPLPRELKLVAEIGQRVTVPIMVHNEEAEPVQLAGHVAYVEGDRTENDFEVQTPITEVEPSSVAVVPVTFTPKQETPEDQLHPTGRETSLELLGAEDEVLAKVRLRGSARPTSKSTERFVEGQAAAHRETHVLDEARHGHVGVPSTVGEMHDYLRAGVEIAKVDPTQAVALVAAVNARLETTAAQHLVYARFAGYGHASTTAIMIIGVARDQTRTLERHLRSGASFNGAMHLAAFDQASEALRVLGGEAKEASALRALQASSPTGRVADAAVETAHDLVTDSKFAVGFGVGIFKGLYDSVRDLLAAILPTAKLAAEIVKEMILGGLPGTATLIEHKLEAFFAAMPGALHSMGAEFEQGWTSEDSYKRGVFRGEVISYVVAQIVLTLMTMGASAAAAAGSKWAKVARMIEMVQAAGDITQYAAKAFEVATILEKSGGNVIRGPWTKAIVYAEEANEDMVAIKRAEREAKEAAEEVAAKAKPAKQPAKPTGGMEVDFSKLTPEQTNAFFEALGTSVTELTPEQVKMLGINVNASAPQAHAPGIDPELAAQDIIPLESRRPRAPEAPPPTRAPVKNSEPLVGQDEVTERLNAQSHSAHGQAPPAPRLYAAEEHVQIIGYQGEMVGQAGMQGLSVDAPPYSLVVVVEGPTSITGHHDATVHKDFKVDAGDGNYRSLKPRSLAQLIKKKLGGDLKKYKRIILVTDCAGSENYGAAKQLAQHMGMPVYAPNDLVSQTMTGPKISNEGSWGRFEPKGSGADLFPGYESPQFGGPNMAKRIAAKTAERPGFPKHLNGPAFVEARSTGKTMEEAWRAAHPQGPIQQKRTRDGTGGDAHELAAHGTTGSGGSLPHLAKIQGAFGHFDLSDVTAHVGGEASEACEAMGAEGYATGNHVAFRGAPDLHTAAHEAAHVVQQRAGVYLKDGLGDTGDVYERHADRVADAVVRGESAEDILAEMTGSGPTHGVQLREAAWSEKKMWLAPFSEPIQRKLITHYMEDTGEPIALSLEEMKACNLVCDIRRADAFVALVAKLQASGGGMLPFIGKGSGGALTSATLGNCTIHWDGAVSVDLEGNWIFKGSLRAHDIYDFDPKRWGVRHTGAEIKTRFANVMLPGSPYRIESVPAACVQFSEDALATWGGQLNRPGDHIAQTGADADSDTSAGGLAGDVGGGMVGGPEGAWAGMAAGGGAGGDGSLGLTEDSNHPPLTSSPATPYGPIGPKSPAVPDRSPTASYPEKK